MKEKTWWDGNSTRAWRLLVIALIGILSFLNQWAFTKITEMPEKYPTKSELQCMVDRLEHAVDKQSAKIDELNRFLRDSRQ